MDVNVWLQSLGLTLMAAVGNILFKMGIDQHRGIDFMDPFSIIGFVFSPYIFLSLILFFLGRVFLSLPLKVEAVGKYMFVLTPLTLVATLALSSLVLRESVDTRQMAGIVLAMIGVYLIGL